MFDELLFSFVLYADVPQLNLARTRKNLETSMRKNGAEEHAHNVLNGRNRNEFNRRNNALGSFYRRMYPILNSKVNRTRTNN